MKRVSLVFGVHNHQPQGTPDRELEQIYQTAYKPLLSVLYRFPGVSAVLHFSGTLLSWIEESHSEFLMLLEEMVKRKQVELLGGGFYEPILPMIPAGDRLGQIEALTTYLRSHFGLRPRGFWIAEGIWEPSLPYSIASSGLDYTFLPEADFRAAGVQESGLFLPHLTEDQGKTILVYPLSGSLPALVGAGEPEEALRYLRSVAAEEEERTVCFLDDGERWGNREDGKGPLSKGGWIERFLGLLEENSEWVATLCPGRLAERPRAHSRTYFPCSMRPDSGMLSGRGRRGAAKAGGRFFRQLMQEYPAGALMYARMMYTHLLVNQIRGDRFRKKAAKTELWKGQGNDAYWCGSRGGVLSSPLRQAVYGALIEAERITRDTHGFLPSIIATDFDMDGADEYLLQGRELNAYVHTSGGALFELDALEASWNYVNTLSRVEANPGGSAPPGGCGERCFHDHFLSQETPLSAFAGQEEVELGDFVWGHYECSEPDRNRLQLQLRRDGCVSPEGERIPLTVEKRYSLSRAGVGVQYRLTNRGTRKVQLCFAPELNLSLPAGPDASTLVHAIRRSRRESIGTESYEASGVEEVLMEDAENEMELRLQSADPFALWALTRGCDEESDSSRYTCLLPRWRLALGPEERWEQRLTLSLKPA